MNKKILIAYVILTLSLSSCKNNTNNIKEEKSQNEISEQATKNNENIQSIENEKIENSSVMPEIKNEGEKATDFNLVDLEGKEYKLSDQKGKKILVKYWASWCPICLAGLEELDNMSKDTENYEIVTVVSPGNLGEKETKDFKEWFSSLGYKNIKVLLDESGKFIEDYAIRSAPTNIMIASDGILVGNVPGQLNKETLDKVYEQIQ